jgi:hypothetical protein
MPFDQTPFPGAFVTLNEAGTTTFKTVFVPAETVTITKAEYHRLLDADRTLDALYAGGVDNWEWYGEALAALDEDEEEVRAD